MREKERGVALILVLLIFSIMTLLSTRLVTDVRHNAARTARYTDNLQARHYAVGAEQFAAVLLEEDFRSDRRAGRMIDHLQEAWARTGSAFTTEEGDISLVIVDDQGRFNLNMLTDSRSRNRRVAQEMLMRLLEAHGLDVRLALRIQDWVDDNQQSLAGGAEDVDYMASPSPHRTADAPLASVSELRLMDILSPEEFDVLLPLVSVLPRADGININTAPAAVLRALGATISQAEADSFAEGRGQQGFSSVREALAHPAVAGRIRSTVADQLVVGSRFFSVYIKARYRDATWYLHSQLARDGAGSVSVVARETGSFPRWVHTVNNAVR